jgi:hypothetical protein
MSTYRRIYNNVAQLAPQERESQ